MAKPAIRQLPVSALIVDPNVQRSVDRNRVAKMADDLDLSAVGVITVSHRGNGSYHVIDGQHRVEAVRLAGGESENVTCRIFDGLSIEDEARMFRLLNNTTKLQTMDRFKVRVVEGDPMAVEIHGLLAKHGWKVSGGANDGHFGAVAAVERVYQRDSAAVERMIATITRAYGHSSEGMHFAIVEAVGSIYARYGETVDDSGLADRMARYHGGPARLIGDARGLAATYRFSLATAVADILVERYNVSRRTKALAPWRS